MGGKTKTFGRRWRSLAGRSLDQGARVRRVWRRRLVDFQPLMLALSLAIGIGVFWIPGQTHEAILALAEGLHDGEPDALWRLAFAASAFFAMSALLAYAFEFFSSGMRRRESWAALDEGSKVVQLIGWILITASPWAWAAAGAYGAHDVVRSLLVAANAANLPEGVSPSPLLSVERLTGLQSALIGLIAGAFAAAAASLVLLGLALRGRRQRRKTDWAVVLPISLALIGLFLWLTLGPVAFARAAFDFTASVGSIGAGVFALFTVTASLFVIARLGHLFATPFVSVLALFFAMTLVGQISEANTFARVALSAVVAAILLRAILRSGSIRFISGLLGVSRYSAGPWLGFAASAAAAGCVGFVFFHAYAPPRIVTTASTAEESTRPLAREPSSLPGFEQAFAAWERTAIAGPGGVKPLFVVAARGGGAYAATASAVLMARLECLRPDFSRNVFAISGVSGGSVGSAVYRALLRHLAAADAAERARLCDPTPSDGIPRLESLAIEIVASDHVGAPLGAFAADIFRKAARPFFVGAGADQGPKLTRYTALARSYATATEAALGPERPIGAARLPALIANTTSAETGIRVAFAPFAMDQVGDGQTFTTFSALSDTLIDDALCPYAPQFDENDPLSNSAFHMDMERALASATFPVVLPSYARCATPATLGGPGRVLNFVDGGYADSSAATTAIEIYEALHRLRGADRADAIPLHLILIGDESGDALQDIAKVEGTALRDSGAILSALLNLRELGSRIAVSQAERRFCDLKAPEGPGRPAAGAADSLFRFDLNREDFKLALGWSISRTTAHAIALQLGRDGWARASARNLPGGAATIAGNSLAMAGVAAAFEGRPVAGATDCARPLSP
ncbi:MAG: hypothetical protein AAFW46_06855 [Pseudomonadota bacterium]